MTTTLPDDIAFMRVALALAERGRYATTPNPSVGCVLVKDGKIIARGFHRRAGEAHAEAVALNSAGRQSRGATAYVSLEPCNHHGRTSPCAHALRAAGIKRVVYALDDPNRDVAGGGAEYLSAAGIEVVSNVCASDASLLNRGFFQRMHDRRPRVRIKLAMSLDGGAALASGESQWITGPTARAQVQQLRAESCAIVTGIGTVMADDPSLTVRDERFDMGGRQPLRIVLDTQLRMSSSAAMLKLPGETRVFTCNADEADARGLRAAGAVIEVQKGGGVALNLPAVLTRLAELEVNEVLVEAGPTLVGEFIAQGCFDQLIVHIAPKLLGSSARRALKVPSPLKLADAPGLSLSACDRLGDDIALTLERTR